MKRVLILCPAHCQPEVLKYTLGTWLETYDGSYEVSLCVGVHSNYGHYSDRLSEIADMKPSVDLVRVNEIDWDKWGMLRYSRMHAHSLVTMMKRWAHKDFTHVAVIDHDLGFKTDFIKWAITRDKDFTASLFGDRHTLNRAPGPNGDVLFAPKPSVWHMVFSRQFFDKLLSDPSNIYPEKMGELVYDTMSRAYELGSCDWEEMWMDIVPEEVIARQVQHFWSLSFNFGLRSAQIETGSTEKAVVIHRKRINEAIERYNQRFPQGISHLLRRIEIV